MAIPERKEQHIITCALCQKGEICASADAMARWAQQHMRHEHNKSTAYLPRAAKSITILYEADDPDSDQPSGVTDPTAQFLRTISRMKEKGLQ